VFEDRLVASTSVRLVEIVWFILSYKLNSVCSGHNGCICVLTSVSVVACMFLRKFFFITIKLLV
jgi:hypothetical protein